MTMKAIIHSIYGSPEHLKLMHVPKPEPKANELLIKIYNTTVNRTDCAMLKGAPPLKLFMGLRKPKNPILGTDFAGIIEETGKKVKNYKVGDKVFGFNDMGLSSHAEYLCITENEAITTLPDNFGFDESVACAEGFHYARNIINKVELAKNDKVLVIGGTGAIGSACIQLANYYGARVSAVCKAEHTKQVLAMGAEKVIDYTTQDYTTLEYKYNYVFDAVGKSSFGKCKTILKNKGCYISSELGPGNENLYLPFITKLFSNKKVKFPFPSNRKESLRLVKELINNGQFKPLIDRSYSLDQIPEAFNYALTGQKVGNLIINMEV